VPNFHQGAPLKNPFLPPLPLRLAEHPKKLILGQYWKVLYILVWISFTNTNTSSSTGFYNQRQSLCC